MTAQQLHQADQALLKRAEDAERRVRQLEGQLEQLQVPNGARRDVRHGTGWVWRSRQAYKCHRCTAKIPRWSTYYRTYHKRKNGTVLRVCYCPGCATVLGHRTPVRKESAQDA